MNGYYNNLSNEVKEYFKILSPKFPEWLFEYIDTPEMQRISKISNSCGTDYSKCFNFRYWYSNLDHSVGVALIIWHFTYDKKQTLAGLFHDIASPVFKHCIDFMNGDSEVQESTEEKTTDIIRNSEKIMSLLKRDGIKLEEVNDYKIYPIADNDSPKLSADRFEYTFSSGLSKYNMWDLDVIRRIYNNIIITKNEMGIDELCFKDKKVCEEYIHIISKLWPEWISDKDRTVMQFLADICSTMNNLGFLTIDDLYTLSEEEVIDKIKNCPEKCISENFRLFQNADTVYSSPEYIEGKYCVNVKSKKRYIIPLVEADGKVNRINTISKRAKDDINAYLNLPNGGYYTYFDFDFISFKEGIIKQLKK